MGGTNPKRAMEYWRAMKSACPQCKVAAATLLDYEPTLIKWTKAFVKAAGKKQPTLWALHNYVSVNRFDEKLDAQAAEGHQGRDLDHRGRRARLPQAGAGPREAPRERPHQTKVTQYMFTKMLKLSPRIKRIYVFHWDASEDGSWDSGLIDKNGKPRPSLGLLEKALGKVPSNQLPTAKPNTPTPVGPADGVLP